MKPMKILLVMLILLTNLWVAQPSWADRGKFIKSSDYGDVTEAINALLAKDAAAKTGLKPAEIQQKLTDLQFQKYILETAEGRAQCTNRTGKTLAVYAKSKKAQASQPATLYYLANGQVTDDDFDCEGIYLPAGTKVSFSLTDVQGLNFPVPIALKIVDGTQLIVTANSETGVLEFNIPPAQIFKSGDVNWTIPSLTQADIDAQVANAPVET